MRNFIFNAAIPHAINFLAMIIRKATPQDATAIQRLLDQLGYPDLPEQGVVEKINAYSGTSYCVLVGELNLSVIGFISMHWFEVFHSAGTIGRISAFCMDEVFRSQGLGQQLLEAAEGFLIKQGCTKLEVTSNIRRLRTHEFYLARGYGEDSRRFTKYIKS